jgi:AcrR family transcriptional regulator
MTADERRDEVIGAAIAAFARGGYASTTTAAIAEQVGVSQPYLFRLFPNKRAIFLAAALRCTNEIRERFAEVSVRTQGTAAHEAMAEAYAGLVGDRDRLMFQMQMYVAVAIAEEAGDEEFALEIRAAWTELWDLVESRLGGVAEASEFMSSGMLINVLLALGFPQDHRVWAGYVSHGGAKKII